MSDCPPPTGEPAGLAPRLRHVYWIGSGGGGGKSTVARRLAARHGLRPYATDEVMADHAGRCSPEDSPRDRMFTDRLAEEARGLRLRVIEVDRTVTEDELTERVAAESGLA